MPIVTPIFTMTHAINDSHLFKPCSYDISHTFAPHLSSNDSQKNTPFHYIPKRLKQQMLTTRLHFDGDRRSYERNTNYELNLINKNVREQIQCSFQPTLSLETRNIIQTLQHSSSHLMLGIGKESWCRQAYGDPKYKHRP